jgi:hypothetical protein
MLKMAFSFPDIPSKRNSLVLPGVKIKHRRVGGKPSIKAHNLMLNHFRVGLDLVGFGIVCAAVNPLKTEYLLLNI